MNSRSLSFFSLSGFNKAVGEPLRLEILRILAQDSYSVLELCEIIRHKQSGMSHHLKILAEAGLVAKRREGNTIFYSRALPNAACHLAELQKQLYVTLDVIDISSEMVARLEQIKVIRVSQSQDFFALQANNFKERQDLIAEYPVYSSAVDELLDKTLLAGHDCVVEVGPGAGEFLPVLAKKFTHVIALDSAVSMLNNAKFYCSREQVVNVDFVKGDTQYLRQETVTADCIVMNMVLHHTPSPADIFMDASSALTLNGALLVTDLCRHDQAWAKQACGDLWLGFEPEQLERWASLAGFKKVQSNYLALRNGFQIQLHQFVKAV
jgi:DNA-binding transcriptional ArsR family regulator/ubiquinone/menaquinone biosynthesis C-methylase UbiE